MKTKLIPLLAGCALFSLGAHAQINITQIQSDNNSGTGNWGQELRLDSSLPAFSSAPTWLIDSFTFYTGSGSGGASSMFLDVYVADTSVEADNDFSSDLSGLTYLGSSTNSVDYTATSQGDPLAFNFSGIEIPVDRDFFVVFSTDSIAGTFLGASIRIEGQDSGQIYTNITDADSDPIFNGGDGGPFDNDNTFTAEFTAVPEPSTYTLFGGFLALGFVLFRRRLRPNVVV